MEHRLLEYFLAVCEELHFTRAAEKLGVSQPTLSQQIRLLEHRLGIPLFHRVGKKIFISEAGHILLRHSMSAFHELDQAKAAIDELQGMQRGRLRIGCSGNHLLVRTILAFHAQYPGIELSVTELATEETTEGLLDNRLDVGIVFLPLRDGHLESIPLYTEELRLVVSERHPQSAADAVRLAELPAVGVVTLQPKFFVRQLLDRYCREAGVALKPIVELSTLDALVQMARHGVGGAILPKSYADGLSDPQVRSIPIVDPTPKKTVGAVYRKETFTRASVNAFLRQLAGDLRESP